MHLCNSIAVVYMLCTQHDHVHIKIYIYSGFINFPVADIPSLLLNLSNALLSSQLYDA
jgi:hypothetical protein